MSDANKQLDRIPGLEDPEHEEPKPPDPNIVELDQPLTLESAHRSNDDLEEEEVDTAGSTMALTTKGSLLTRAIEKMWSLPSSLFPRIFKGTNADHKQDVTPAIHALSMVSSSTSISEDEPAEMPDLEDMGVDAVSTTAVIEDNVADQSVHALLTASSSTSISQDVLYDIFLRFRGEDTRYQFTAHLNKELKEAGFRTFRDEDNIPMGNEIKSELVKAIINSRMSVVILSQNYANSKACLLELQTILEQCEKSNHLILPVFYGVKPGQIKMDAKNLSFEQCEEATVEGWSAALINVAARAGKVYLTGTCEVKFIEEIIVRLKSMLSGNNPRNGDHPKLEENGRDLAGRQLKPPPEDFVEYTTRNTENVWKCLMDVKKLEEKGRVLAGRLLKPPPEDFVEYTTRNTENVWKCLMDVKVTRIGVYGMGGIGKTTIMEHIHSQLLEEKSKFDTVYWVTSSKAFNITSLQRDIAKALDICLSDGEDERRSASELYTKLFQMVDQGERYVLILDDLWKDFVLGEVGLLEPTPKNGCKLVVTTRSLEVCNKMACTTVEVELFTEQEALTLFLRKAVEHDLVPEVKEIATKMAKECAHLPLAIVTVAGSMRGLKEAHEWRNALAKLINSTKDIRDGDSKVFECLKFSYTRLGNKVLQDCFLHCALYPEDHDIHVKELIEYWIAEGLIVDYDSVQAQFDEGQVIFRKLTDASLLKKLTNESGEVCVRIHDLIRDMALTITKGSPRFMVKSGTLVSITYEDWCEDLEKISFTYNFIKELPEDPPRCPRLTTLLFGVNELSLIPNSFFAYMYCLKVLDLSAKKIKLLPNSISDLVNLLALILADSKLLEDVPSLKKLKALKVFKLTNSLIKNLPEGIEDLVNLRKLDLSDNKKLKFTSRKLRRLSKLQSLIVDGTRVEVSAEDLRCLSQLKVVSVHLRNVTELTCYVTSQQFQGLEKYSLMLGRDMWPLSNGNEVLINAESEPIRSEVGQVVLPSNINFLVLQGFHVPISLSAIPGLKDARHLHRCEVRGCDGLQFIFSSSYLSEESQISLRTVESFYLSDLPSCSLLFDGIIPPRNISFNLKRLTFESCHIVKNIFPVELLQNFPNLEQLKVDRCDNVEDIIAAGEEKMSDSNTITLPRLQYLFLNSLPKLKSIYTGKMVCESVKLIHVTKCSTLSRLPLSLQMDNEQATAPPALKCITGEEEWWESLVWDHLPTKSALEPFLERGLRNDVTSLAINDTDSYVDSDEDANTDTESWTLVP